MVKSHRNYSPAVFDFPLFFNSHPKKSGFNPWFNAQTGSGNIYSQWARGDSYRASIVLKIGKRSLSRRKLWNDPCLIKSISQIAPPSTPYSRYGSFMVFTVTCLFSSCEIWVYSIWLIVGKIIFIVTQRLSNFSTLHTWFYWYKLFSTVTLNKIYWKKNRTTNRIHNL